MTQQKGKSHTMEEYDEKLVSDCRHSGPKNRIL